MLLIVAKKPPFNCFGREILAFFDQFSVSSFKSGVDLLQVIINKLSLCPWTATMTFGPPKSEGSMLSFADMSTSFPLTVSLA